MGRVGDRAVTLLVSLILASQVFAAETIDVYADRAMLERTALIRVPGVQLRTHIVDQAQSVDQLMTQSLAGFGRGAQITPDMFKRYVQTPVGRQHLQQLKAAWQIPFDAFNRGVRKVPAIVIDGRYVVYGTLDIRRVLLDVKAFRIRE